MDFHKLNENSGFSVLIIVRFPSVFDLDIIGMLSVEEDPGQDSQLMNMPRLILHFICLTVLLQQSK